MPFSPLLIYKLINYCTASKIFHNIVATISIEKRKIDRAQGSPKFKAILPLSLNDCFEAWL